MIDHDTFLRMICANPDDDGPRLVYADQLEEWGDSDRAEFIRCQIEFERHPWAKNIREGDYDARDGIDPVWQRGFDLHARSRELLGTDVLRHGQRGEIAWAGVLAEIPDVDYEFRRGFVDTLSCTLADFVGGRCERCEGAGDHESPIDTRYSGLNTDLRIDCPNCRGTGTTPGLAASIATLAPITDVRLTDREPADAERMLELPDEERSRLIGFVRQPHHAQFLLDNAGYWWSHHVESEDGRDREWWVPKVVFDLMIDLPGADYRPDSFAGRVGFPTTADAHAALSRACVAFARGFNIPLERIL